MKNMNQFSSKVFATASVLVAPTVANSPFSNIFHALAAPVGSLTPEKLISMIPKSKEESPLVGENDLYGRGWDLEWSAWAHNDEE